METNSQQEKIWKSDFGKNYTDRNVYSPNQLDEFYIETYDVSRAKMNEDFIGSLPRSIKILEVGSNVGNQLLSLHQMGFKNLYGIELQEYAVEISKSRTKGINILQGSAFDIPFKDNFFDLVFTSGVLIHISPDNLKTICSEIFRCSNKFIWGFEYYSEEFEEIVYRENKNLLWKADYAGLYKKYFPLLQLLKKENYKYVSSENVDQMFLLQK